MLGTRALASGTLAGPVSRIVTIQFAVASVSAISVAATDVLREAIAIVAVASTGQFTGSALRESSLSVDAVSAISATLRLEDAPLCADLTVVQELYASVEIEQELAASIAVMPELLAAEAVPNELVAKITVQPELLATITAETC